MHFMYPPKPMLVSIDQPLFQELSDRKDVVAELKFNGTRLVLDRLKDGSFIFWGRDGKKLAYKPSQAVLAELASFAWKGECRFDGELLHSRTKDLKNKIILFDVFIWDSGYLGNFPFKERRDLLVDACGGNSVLNPSMNFVKITLEGMAEDPNSCFLSPQFSKNFPALFNRFTTIPWIEGLVMKRLDSRLVIGTRTSPVVAYMWKVRKPGPSYRF